MSLSAIKDELLRSLFPSLRPEHDPDIERYFDLRKAGRPGDALALYSSRLKPRYPDCDFRSHLLRAYRTRSPVYRQLLVKAYGNLGDHLLEQTKQTIKLIAVKAMNFDSSDAYSTIKAAEAIIVFLPKERFVAIATIERYHRYSIVLNFYSAALSIAENLVRAYLTDTLSSVVAERQRRQQRQEQIEQNRRKALIKQDRLALETAVRTKQFNNRIMKEKERRKYLDKGKRQKPVDIFDFSKIRFSASDLARIQIPPTLTKLEDKTLAYCFKYWNLVNDSAFERVIYLYSRLNKSKHYEVYSIIKAGRRSGRSDEEILTIVLSVQTTSYYYSIRGDAYLRSSWLGLRKKLELKPLDNMKAAHHPPVSRRRQRLEVGSSNLPSNQTSAFKTQTINVHIENTATPREVIEKPIMINSSAVNDIKSTHPVNTNNRLPVAPYLLGSSLAVTRDISTVKTTGSDVFKQTAKALEQYKNANNSVRTGSVADKLRLLSGRSYDVYKDRFFGKVRGAIRRVLAENRDGHHNLFASIPQEAEECVFSFLLAHYEDPFMDWENSRERVHLDNIGFPLSSLDPVIKECYAKL